MSNYLAIATVTAALRRTLLAAVQADEPAATVTTIRPDASSGLPDPGANVFLYQATPNAAWRNADLPTRDRHGGVVQRPVIALDLHYLFTFYGDEGQLLPQRVLGAVVRTLQARPYLTRDSIRGTLADPLYAHLAASDLADEVELVKFTPIPLSLEEVSKLWSVLLQTSYALSMAYLATVVLIEAEETPRRALPVRERSIIVSPFQRAVVERVISDTGAGEPVRIGDTVVLEGTQLAGTIDRVRVGVANLQPVAGSVTPSRLSVALTDPGLRSGVIGVQVVYTSGAESNVAALVLRPTITVVQAAVTATLVPIDFDPAVSRRQRTMIFLNELGAPPDRAPRAYGFEGPAENGIVDPADESTTRIPFAISGVEPGEYLVRVQVGGAENVLETDTNELSPTFGQYIEPRAVIPP